MFHLLVAVYGGSRTHARPHTRCCAELACAHMCADGCVWARVCVCAYRSIRLSEWMWTTWENKRTDERQTQKRPKHTEWCEVELPPVRCCKHIASRDELVNGFRSLWSDTQENAAVAKWKLNDKGTLNQSPMRMTMNFPIFPTFNVFTIFWCWILSRWAQKLTFDSRKIAAKSILLIFTHLLFVFWSTRNNVFHSFTHEIFSKREKLAENGANSAELSIIGCFAEYMCRTRD